jgi:hypothetical protein
LYQWAYTPRERVPIIFKEVNLEFILEQLLAKTDVPIVYLLRHPCAVVWSHARGAERELMPVARHAVLDSLMHDQNPALARKLPGGTAEMDAVEKSALLWRLDVERALRAFSKAATGLPVFYENLCRHPKRVSQQVLEHLGLEHTAETEKFVEHSTNPSFVSRFRYGDYHSKKYFSTFRDSRKSCHRWREEMPVDQQHKVLRIVEDSEVFQLGREAAAWAGVAGD